ncbi:alpha-amylase family glycosyl hydrolase [Streptomyces sparsogenes]
MGPLGFRNATTCSKNQRVLTGRGVASAQQTAEEGGSSRGGPDRHDPERRSAGFDPTDKGFCQGGDLKDLTKRPDYIKGLGTTAIWMAPIFKNKPVQGNGESAGCHGYWSNTPTPGRSSRRCSCGHARRGTGPG